MTLRIDRVACLSFDLVDGSYDKEDAVREALEEIIDEAIVSNLPALYERFPGLRYIYGPTKMHHATANLDLHETLARVPYNPPSR